MNCLIYVSTASRRMSFQDVKNIAEKAAVNNAENDISGLLVYGNNFFMQILEGEDKKINELYLKVSHDERHKDICLLSYDQILFRQFSSWAMGCLMLDSNPELSHVIETAFPRGSFNPYILDSKKAIQLLNELSKFYDAD